MSKQSYEPKGTAQVIRKQLKAEFPGVKFSVKTGRSGFDIVRVEWIDGPTWGEVDALMGKYATQGFDGMTDCRYRLDNETDWGIAWVVCERDFSQELSARAEAFLDENLDGFSSLHEWDRPCEVRSFLNNNPLHSNQDYSELLSRFQNFELAA